MLLLASLVAGVVVPLQRRAAASGLQPTPAPRQTLVPGGKVQVQRAPHSLVHIQEGIVYSEGPGEGLGCTIPFPIWG